MSSEVPGVYIEEIPSGLRTIQALPTARTGFIGAALKGPLDQPILITSFGDYERLFGGLWSGGPMSYAVWAYFQNGGADALVVRVAKKRACLLNLDLPFLQGVGNQQVGFSEIAAPGLAAEGHGLWAFERVKAINILCIPPFAPQVDVDHATLGSALAFCKARSAFLVVDPPSTWDTIQDITQGIGSMGLQDANAALFLPRLQTADPLNPGRNVSLAPGGAVAGIMARTDLARGVWKAPAGVEAALAGNPTPEIAFGDPELDILNPLGLNSLRQIPNGRTVVWGARTLSSDPEWKYIPVRRTYLFIDASLRRGLEWVVFEPNDEPLWAQIRTTVGAFMQTLFQKGAFAGTTSDQAYFVKCDRETTTPNDIERGIANLLVGFAPLKPAEFVVIKLKLTASQGR